MSNALSSKQPRANGLRKVPDIAPAAAGRLPSLQGKLANLKRDSPRRRRDRRGLRRKREDSTVNCRNRPFISYAAIPFIRARMLSPLFVGAIDCVLRVLSASVVNLGRQNERLPVQQRSSPESCLPRCCVVFIYFIVPFFCNGVSHDSVFYKMRRDGGAINVVLVCTSSGVVSCRPAP